MSTLSRIFICALALAALFQGARLLRSEPMLDIGIWADEARFVQTQNPEQFNKKIGYGHPGGPVIEGAIAIHEMTGAPYDKSVIALIAVLDSLVIATICVWCYILRRDVLWPAAVLGFLSFTQLFRDATPPSMLASLLIVLLSLLTLYLYERKHDARPSVFFFWSIVAGAVVATRADVGSVTTAVFGLFLLTRYPLKRVFLLALGAVATFVVLDPFMWAIPLRHPIDLFVEVLYHYAEISPNQIGSAAILGISIFGGVSALLAVATLLLRKHIPPPLPDRFVYFLLVMSVGLYGVFLTAHFQATRYFMPVIFLWEAFLPLYIIAAVSKIEFSFAGAFGGQARARRVVQTALIALLLAIPFLLVCGDFLRLNGMQYRYAQSALPAQ